MSMEKPHVEGEERPSRSARPRVDATASGRPSPSVLVVEDSPVDAEIVERELRKTFGEVSCWVVDTPEAFSAALQTARWDVIIADHALPRFSSTEALRALKASGRDIPFVIVSGSMDEESAVAAMKAGASDYVTKQNLGRLGPAVERELRDASSRRQLLQAQKMEAVGRLASGIAHDFNNILVVILGDAEFLLDELPETHPLRPIAQELREAGVRAKSLVRQLLTFSRRDAPYAAPVTVHSVVQGIEQLLRRTIGEDVAVSVSLDPDPWKTCIDRGHLEQVLLNLALNARDAMPFGGSLYIRARNEVVAPRVPGREFPPSPHVVLEVSDTGSGMTPEVLSKAFEPFFTTKDRGKGTGLGLSIAYGSVEQARGRIEVASEPDRGTTFTIFLPACSDSSPEPTPQKVKRRGGGGTALLVEDDDAVRRVTRRMLEHNGFRVVEAQNPGDVLTLLEKGEAVDVVLSDVVMPGGSGVDLAALVARARPGLPVVLASGYSDRQGPGTGAGPVLAKPFTEEELMSRIDLELGRSGRGA